MDKEEIRMALRYARLFRELSDASLVSIAASATPQVFQRDTTVYEQGAVRTCRGNRPPFSGMPLSLPVGRLQQVLGQSLTPRAS
jgi:hypothetical protein